MIKFPSKETVLQLRKEYPEGTRIELIKMNDTYVRLMPGTRGTVSYIDDMGTIFCKWDDGFILGVILEEDIIKKL